MMMGSLNGPMTHISHSKSCKFQNFNGPFKLFMGPLQNLMGSRILKLISTLEQNSHEI